MEDLCEPNKGGTATITGGCLCGALRYTATEPPRVMGYCCCEDCRRASGSGFIPFMGFAARALTITGAAQTHRLRHADGREALRNFCPACGGLVFGGIRGQSESHTIYAGSLDDPGVFKPSMAIFLRDKPDWVILPPGLKTFDTMPS